MMSKSIFLFITNTLAIFVAISLLPTPVFSDDSEIETGSTSYEIQLVSEECEYSPDKTWPANEILYLIVNRTDCFSGGPCWGVSCSSGGQLRAEDLNQNIVLLDMMSPVGYPVAKIEDMFLQVDVTFVDTNITCHDQSVVRLSRVLTPSQYLLSRTIDDFRVITETVALEPLPTLTPTPTPIPPGEIEGYVWHDINEDGIRDDDEPGVAGVSISLTNDCDGGIYYTGTQDQTKTDSQGLYQFSDVDRKFYEGRYYRLQFDKQLTYTTSGQSDRFWMPITGTLRGIDAGIIMTDPQSPGYGMTWSFQIHSEDIPFGYSSCSGCKTYRGDTLCTRTLPILCLLVDGSPRPPYDPPPTNHTTTPGEFYSGWANGSVGATTPIDGRQLTSSEVANAICEEQLGPGYRMAEYHDGLWIEGMDSQTYFGNTWPKQEQLNSGGWNFFSLGEVPSDTRYWVNINDRPANCWNSAPIPNATPTPTFTPTPTSTSTATATRTPTRVVPRETATPVPDADSSLILTSDRNIYLPIISQ